jgi:hypothetical protein
VAGDVLTADGERVSFAVTARSWPQNTGQVDRWYTALENSRLGDNQPAPD